MPSALVRDLKALLDGLAKEAGFEEDPLTEEGILRREAIGGFIAGGPQLLDEATRFLRAYYWSTAAEFTPRERIQLVYADGVRLCKVGQHDGHVTVAHAYGDASLLGVVFC